MLPQVDICVLCHNQSTITSSFLTNIAELTENTEYKLWVLDNASDDPQDRTKRVLKWFRANTRWWGNLFRPRYPGVKFKAFHSKKNLGYSGGNNFLAKQGKAPWICFINNDAFPIRSSWLDQLMFSAMLNDWDAIGPISNFVIGLQDVRWDRIFSHRHRAKILSGFCFMVRRDVFEEVGGWDENFFMGDEDIDLSFRLCDRGWNTTRKISAIGVDRQVYVNHLGSRSMAPWCEKNEETVEEHFYKTHNQLIEKYDKLRVLDMWFWEDIRKPKEMWAEMGVLPNGRFNCCPGTNADWSRFVASVARKAGGVSRTGAGGSASQSGNGSRGKGVGPAQTREDNGSAAAAQSCGNSEARERTGGYDPPHDAWTKRGFQDPLQLLHSGNAGGIGSARSPGPRNGSTRVSALDWARFGGGVDRRTGPQGITHWGCTETGLSFGTGYADSSARGNGHGGRQCARRQTDTYCGTCAPRKERAGQAT